MSAYVDGLTDWPIYKNPYPDGTKSSNDYDRGFHESERDWDGSDYDYDEDERE